MSAIKDSVTVVPPVDDQDGVVIVTLATVPRLMQAARTFGVDPLTARDLGGLLIAAADEADRLQAEAA